MQIDLISIDVMFVLAFEFKHIPPHTAHIVVRFIIQEIVFSMINVIFFLFSGTGFLILETRNVGDVPPSIYTKKLFLDLIVQNDGISLVYVRYSLKNSCFLFFVKSLRRVSSSELCNRKVTDCYTACPFHSNDIKRIDRVRRVRMAETWPRSLPLP